MELQRKIELLKALNFTFSERSEGFTYRNGDRYTCLVWPTMEDLVDYLIKRFINPFFEKQ